MEQPEVTQEWLFIAGGLILSLFLRLSLWDWQTTDFTIYSGPWQDYIAQHGGWRALKDNFGNYTPPYLYLLTIGTYLPLSKLYVVKFISLPLDFVLAWLVAKLVGLKYERRAVCWLAFFVTLFAPTVICNGALWGQTDAGYTIFLLAALLYAIKQRPAAFMLCFGCAFALKLQAVFFAPLLVILFFRREVRLRHFLLVPAPYLLAIIPAWLIGRPLKSLLGIYSEQAEWTADLTKNAANMYQFLPNNPTLGRAGLILAAALVYLFCAAVTLSRKPLRRDLLVKLALASTLLVPYFVPRMHERYFFPADIFAIVFAFYFPRYFYLPIIVIGISWFSYAPFLFDQTPVPLIYLALVLGAALVIVAMDLTRNLLSGAAD